MRIKNARVYDPDGIFRIHDIAIEGGVFTRNGGGAELDARGLTALPGLIDIHFHGCAGVDFSDGGASVMRKMAEYEAINGITTMVPATMTLPEQQLLDVCGTAAALSRTNDAELAGINLEGPFISKAMRGSQNEAYIRVPDIGMMERLLRQGKGLVKLVTIAPESEGAEQFIEAFSKRVRISLGHTDCDYETAKWAFGLGIRHVTHFYNAMNPYTHRAPGLVGAVFDDGQCMAELICDGVHVHPAAIRTTFKILGDRRIILISDTMRAAGMKDGEYTLGGLNVTVRGGKAMLTGTDTLAGSVTNLMHCLRYAVNSAGIPLESAVRCATENPARAAGLYEHCGSIALGKKADLLLVDDHLELKQVILRGGILNKV